MKETSTLQSKLAEEFKIASTHSIESYALRLSQFLELYVRLPDLTLKKERELKLLKEELDKYVPRHQNNFTRRQLYSSLTIEPFFSALQLIDIRKKKEIVSQNFLLLAHLFIARGHDDYPAYLAFYKMAESAQTPLFSCSFLQSCTLDELRIETQSLAQALESKPLLSLASFLKRRDPRTLSKPKQSMTTGLNRHERIVDRTTFGRIASVQFSDEDGSQTSALLKYTPNLILSETKQKLQFSKKRAGLQNALYNFESNTPWASHNATPAEITLLLKCISDGLIDGAFGQLDSQTAGLLAILFLKLFGVAEPEGLTLVNAGSPNYDLKALALRSLVYEIDKSTQRLDAHIRFNAHLLEVKKPSCQDMRIHHVAREHVDIGLPFPIPQLLKQAFKKVQATKRNHKALDHAFGVDVKHYRQWLREHIKASRLDAIGMTTLRIERAFEHFSREHVPEVAFNYLSGKATVQHHYVSFERAEMERVLKSSWFKFLDETALKRLSSNADNFATSFARAHHDAIGSSHVLRQEVLELTLASCIHCASDELASPIERLNQLALYTYIRIASTSALRPVTNPLPDSSHFHDTLGLLSVADKRAHHKEERRLITLTNSCDLLLKAFSSTANRISIRFNLPAPTSILMLFDNEARNWTHLSAKNTNELLSTMVDDVLENRSLRHVAASAFVSSHVDSFSQSALNLLMNHVRSNVSVLNRRSLTSIESLTQKQRLLINEADALPTYDTTALRLLTTLGESV